MNGYLVVIRCRNDDVPVALVDNLDKAIEITGLIDPEDSQYVQDVVSSICWREPSKFVAVSIVKFVEGYPVRTVYLRGF